MRKLLAANFRRLWKTSLFRGAALIQIAFAIFRLYTLCDDLKYGYPVTLDDALFTHIMVEGVITAVFISVFLGTEYSDGTLRNKIAAGHERVSVYLANLITVTAAGYLFIAVYTLTVLAAGIPLLGGPVLDAGTILSTLAGTLATTAAFCSLYTLLAMGLSSKSTGSILCILLFFGMMIGSTYCAAMLDAQPERMVVEMVDGEMVSHMEPNPKYPTERERAGYQFAIDFLPTGQATQYVVMAGRTGRMSLYSGLIVLVTTAGGAAYFRKKDLK